jgi:hypothetical protein
VALARQAPVNSAETCTAGSTAARVMGAKPKLGAWPAAVVLSGAHLRCVGHIEAVDAARRANAPGDQEHLEAVARAEFEHGLARLEAGQGQGVAAAERGGTHVGLREFQIDGYRCNGHKKGGAPPGQGRVTARRRARPGCARVGRRGSRA